MPKVVSPSAAGAAPRPIVQTVEGAVRGIRRGGVDAYKGLHYGESTAGANRFRPPVPVRPWAGVREADALGDACYQGSGSEDCLVLNVWSPLGAKDVPVMVFLHGGGYRGGSGGEPMYDGARLAELGDVVVVTVNHRLHILGFLYLADFSDELSGCTNVGILDLVEALRWIKRNIAAFGGDPGNVTIFGESGGGGKVCCLMSMPAATGLFHKAIVQSGSQRRLACPSDAAADAEAALDFLGVSKQDLSALQSMPVERLYEAFLRVERGRPRSLATLSTMPFVPVLDEGTLPWHPSDPEAMALSGHIPLMVGTNDAEVAVYLGLDPGFLKPPASERDVVDSLRSAFVRATDVAAGDLESLVAAYRAERSRDDWWDLFIAIASDLWMTRDALALVEARLELSGAPTFVYRFAWKEACFGGHYASHAAELLFVFDKLDGHPVWGTPTLAEPEDRDDPEGHRPALRDAVVQAWSSFAVTGFPVVAPLPAWPAYDRGGRAEFIFDAECAVVRDRLGPVVRERLAKLDVGAGA